MNNRNACSFLQRFSCVLFGCIVLTFAKANAQQTSSIKNERQHLQSTFEVVHIDLLQYLKLEIKTSTSDQVKIITRQNGEYRNAVVLTSIVRNDSLLITDPIHPSFTFPGDKLSVHKVVDGDAIIYIPRFKKVVLNTQNADITISGVFKNVYINQLSGSCKMNQIQSDLNYISIYADVFIALEKHDITSFSKSGKVSIFIKPTLIEFFASIETVSGNISHIKKTNK